MGSRTAILLSLLACAMLFLVMGSSRDLGAGITSVNAPRFAVCRTPVSRNVAVWAHKKGSGSTENGRDSNSKRLGLKVTHNKVVPAGSIIFRQRGQKVHPGQNVAVGKDYTLFATKTGVVKFTNGAVNRGKKHQKMRKIAHIIPEEPVAETNVEAL
ncbi:hypothetical protein AAMO2058_000463800 [Amorphochlora amoebiformis]